MVPVTELAYHPSMLGLYPDASRNALLPQPVLPRTLQSLANSPSIRDYSRAAWRGFGCSACGRLSSRSQWLKLNCQECGAQVDATGSLVTVEAIQSATRQSVRGRKPAPVGEPLLLESSVARRPIEAVRDYAGHTYELADGARVHHLWPTLASGYGKADRLFEGYQGESAGKLFKRNPLNMHRCESRAAVLQVSKCPTAPEHGVSSTTAQGSLLCQQCESILPSKSCPDHPSSLSCD